MDATQIGIDDEVFIIMYNPDSIEGMPNEKRLDNYIKTSNCTVYKYNELMEDGELFERLVSKVIEEKERIRIETEISKEVQEK